MTTETSFIGRGAVLALSGVFAIALSPAVLAPAAMADTETTVSASDSLETVNSAVSKIQTALDQNDVAKNSEAVVELYDFIVSAGGQDALSEDQLVYVASCLSYQLDAAKTQLSSAQKQLEEAQAQIDSTASSTLKNKTKISKLTVTAPAMGKVVASWKVKNAIDGLSYQIKYRAGSGKWATAKTSKLTKTFKSLTAGKTYTFKVRAYKKLGGKKVYSSWSKTASAKVIASYKKGSYKVTGDWLNVHQKASVTSDNSDVLVSIPQNTKVKITKVKLVKGIVWGKLTYHGQTGWVQMQYLKKA